MITPIGINNNKTQYKPVSFKAHPDFEKLVKHYPVTASSFFRRGPYYGSDCEEFRDVISVFKEIFKEPQKPQNPQKMLIVGIGDSQEIFSYLAVIKNLLKNTPLEKVVDLHTVDLQSAPSKQKLFLDSFYEHSWEPVMVRDSFVADEAKNYGGYNFKHFRVLDEIFEYVHKVYGNVRKSIWDSRIQEKIQDYPQDFFDIISINNTLGYITNKDDVISTYRHVNRILKQNGVFITDPVQTGYFRESGILKHLVEIREGIYQKQS